MPARDPLRHVAPPCCTYSEEIFTSRLEQLLRELEVAPPATQQAALQRLRVFSQRRTASRLLFRSLAVAALLLGAMLLAGRSTRQVAVPVPARVRSDHTRPMPLVEARHEPPRPLAPDAESVRSRYPPHAAFDHPLDAMRRLRRHRNTSSFPLVVCVGHGKTATKSLNKALVMLGWKTAHFYGAGVYGLLYGNAAEQQAHDFLFDRDRYGKHVDAVLDTPVVDFYSEILLAYPNARFILTLRDPASWLKSQQHFYCCYAKGCHNWLAPWRRGSNLVFGTECPSREQAIKRYVLHNRNVFDTVPRDRLLLMDIPGGAGWEQLCRFLGLPVPPSNWTFPSRH